MDRQAVIDLERKFMNLAQSRVRSGEHDKAAAYRYAASLVRQALKDAS